MSVQVARTAARRAGFDFVAGDLFIRKLISLCDKETVVCLLKLASTGRSDRLYWQLNLNAKQVELTGTGTLGEFEDAITAALILYEVEILRKEAESG